MPRPAQTNEFTDALHRDAIASESLFPSSGIYLLSFSFYHARRQPRVRDGDALFAYIVCGSVQRTGEAANGYRRTMAPDVILVGEIRDLATAEIIMQAALTGDLVISTLHPTNSAATLRRLVDIGIEPFLIGSALVGVVAQRLLVRMSCAHCKEPIAISPRLRAHFCQLALTGGYQVPSQQGLSKREQILLPCCDRASSFTSGH